MVSTISYPGIMAREIRRRAARSRQTPKTSAIRSENASLASSLQRLSVAAQNMPERQLAKPCEIVGLRLVHLHPHRADIGAREEPHLGHHRPRLVGEKLVRRDPVLERVGRDEDASRAVDPENKLRQLASCGRQKRCSPRTVSRRRGPVPCRV